MHPLRALWCRAYQTVFRVALPVLPYTEPQILDSVEDVAGIFAKKGVSSALLVTDPGIARLGLTRGLEKSLGAAGVRVAVYSKTVANPTVDNVEEAAGLYRSAGCQAIIGFGGGSAMDCAKAVGARIAQPNKPVNKMRGLLRVHRRLPLLIAVPTTAGTGSEVTLAAVITDSTTHHKYPINDFVLIPRYAVHDPRLTIGLPPAITAQTGMDALTHAIEGYTTKGAWELSDMFHFEAIKLISENLRDSVAEAKSGQPGSGREGMALGQYVAGMGFSNVGLGIDHAMAHTLSAHYDTPHGVACAMLLPIAMEFNKPVCTERLAKVAVAMGVDTTGMSTDEAADAAIAAVKQLSADVNIPHVCEAMKADEIEVLAKDAMADACFPGNPREATLDDVIELFKKICPSA